MPPPTEPPRPPPTEHPSNQIGDPPRTNQSQDQAVKTKQVKTK